MSGAGSRRLLRLSGTVKLSLPFGVFHLRSRTPGGRERPIGREYAINEVY
jgi:hypothetical protein